jgi:hypothetical protein
MLDTLNGALEMFKKWSDDLVIEWLNDNYHNMNSALAIHTVCAYSGRKRVEVIALLKAI